MTEQPTQPQAPDHDSQLALAEALVKLLTTELDDIPVLHSSRLTTWTLGGFWGPLHASVTQSAGDPFDTIRTLVDRIEGANVETDKGHQTSDGDQLVMQTVCGSWQGHRLCVDFFVKQTSVESELRRRIAELEAQQGGETRG